VQLYSATLASAQITASLAVTVHALLRKRNTISATAWIGLAWFAPAIGALLYLALGINRVERRAHRLRRQTPPGPTPPLTCVVEPPHLAPLDLAMGRITGRPCMAGACTEVLRNGDAAYPRMLDAINGAQTSIALTSYIFRDDPTGRLFIAALAAAARRGVQVRVLIDAIGGGYLRSLAWRRLRASGVPAARFLHSRLLWRTPILNLRSHRKLLVVDGAIAFCGGLNIGAENVPGLQRGRRRRVAVRDTHFMVRGPVVAQAMAMFAEDWRFTTGEVLAGPSWFPPLAPCGPSSIRVVTSGPDHELERLKAALLTAIGAARTRIRVMTPYFLPDEPLSLALALAALRGVDVGIVLPARSDNRLVDWAARDGLAPLLAAGCTIWHSARPFDHSKLMTVDGTWCLVGSANWDTRSLRLNFEMNLEIRDSALATQLDAIMASHSERTVRASDLTMRKLPARLRDAAARLLLPYL
jgi:cardiolipin synthase